MEFDNLDILGVDENDEALPFPFKLVMLGLVLVALILVVFSASVGAICRIQCKVGMQIEEKEMLTTVIHFSSWRRILALSRPRVQPPLLWGPTPVLLLI